jgi:ligand-binding sensor domain-containing protein
MANELCDQRSGKRVRIKRWVHTQVGDPPGAYCVVVLWGLLLAKLLDVLQIIINSIASLSPLRTIDTRHGIYIDFNWVLPLAILMAGFHIVLVEPASLKHNRRLAWIGISVALAVLAHRVRAYIPDLAGLMIIFALIAGRCNCLTRIWRAIIVGAIGGSCLVSLLSDTVQALVLRRMVPGFKHTAVYSWLGWTTTTKIIVAIIIFLAIGPATVWWGKARSWKSRWATGAFSGGIAGTALFNAIGGPAAGIIAQSVLYGVAFSREGYGAGEWTLKFALGIERVFPWTIGSFWLLVCGGALVGGLTGWLTPIRLKPKHNSTDDMPDWPLAAMAIFIFFLAASAVAWSGFLPPVVFAIQKILDQHGVLHSWFSEWMVPIVFFHFWLPMTTIQILGLWWIQHYRDNDTQKLRTTGVARAIGIIGLAYFIVLLIILGVYNFREPLLLGASLITAAASFEMLLVQRRYWGEGPPIIDAAYPASIPKRIAGAVAGGCLAAGFLSASTSGVLSIALIGVAMVQELAGNAAAPRGAGWLSGILGMPFSSVSVLLGISVISAIVSGICGQMLTADWMWRLGSRLDRRLKAIGMVQRLSFIMSSRSTRDFRATPFTHDYRFFLKLLFVGLIMSLGLLGLARPQLFQVSIATVKFSLLYLALIVLGTIIGYKLLQPYIPAARRFRTRLTLLIGVACLVGLFSQAGQEQILAKGGVTLYDGQRWQAFSPQKNEPGGQLNYHFFADAPGRVWQAGGGRIFSRSEEKWHAYGPMDPYSGLTIPSQEQRMQALGGRMLFSEDKKGRLWIALGNLFGQCDPRAIKTNLRIPSMTVAGKSPAQFKPESPITALALDPDGKLWIATAGNGVIRMEVEDEPEKSRWASFTQSNSGLASNDVQAIYADRKGNLWMGTKAGLNRFDGVSWQFISLPGVKPDCRAVTFLEDNTTRLWVGTTAGVFAYDGQDLRAFNPASGWPGNAGVNCLFLDRQGCIWAGTEMGALRFEGNKWNLLAPTRNVTSFAEGPAGWIWVGSREGLIRYDLATAQRASFDSANSAMPTNEVQDLLVDKDGNLWVSTFKVARSFPSPWLAVAMGFSFFGYLITDNYRKYIQTPQARARQWLWRSKSEPDHLYANLYALIAHAPDAPEVMTELSELLAQIEDQSGGKAVKALAELCTSTADSDIDGALSQTVTSLAADGARAQPLLDTYRLLGELLKTRRVVEIAALELTVNPGLASESPVVETSRGRIDALPPFLSKGLAETMRSFEQIGIVLRKYQDVDTVADRLSYLAAALTEAEKAQAAAQSATRMEGEVLAAIVRRWRIAITNEIHLISGRANLRLELRTRQVRRSENAPAIIVLRLQNVGRATAENVVVAMESKTDPRTTGSVALERLAPGRAKSIEFSITHPAAADVERISWRVAWDDRVQNNNVQEFADEIRFYRLTQTFQRIPNPFIVGHPVKSPEMFRGREEVFQFIIDNLSGPAPNRTLVLHGQRRTGKTSILYQLLRGRLGANFIPVLIDMQEMALLINNTGDLLGEMAHQLTRTARQANVSIVEPPEAAFAASPTRAFNRFLEALEENLGGRRLVVMFDEFELIESKINEGKLEADLLGYLRSLIQHRERLTFLFTGTHRLEEMSREYWSILFNIALYRRISYLNPSAASQLIREPVAGRLDIDELAVEKIYSLTNGHPYFVQLLSWALVNYCNAQERNYATINDVNDAVQEILVSGEAHFAYIWQRADYAERLALTGLAHALGPAKEWARPAEVQSILSAGGFNASSPEFMTGVLDRLTGQEVLEAASEGALRYRFQIEVLRLWVETTKSVSVLVERGHSPIH